MARGRRPGVPNRTFPSLTLERAMEMPRVINDGASGLPVDRLTLSELLDKSPSSSVFMYIVLASRAYGLTTGGKNADEFGLTPVGNLAVSDDPAERTEGLRKAVLNIEPFRAFLTAYDKKKVPLPAAFRAFLINQAGVSAEHVEQCMTQLLDDARLAGFLRSVKGSEWIDLQNVSPAAAPTASLVLLDEAEALDDVGAVGDGAPTGASVLQEGLANEQATRTTPTQRPSAIFLGHGKNKKPLDQLTKMLAEYKIPYKVAVDEPNHGRPISQKVADVMDECGAAILIFTADQEFRDAEGNIIWRPSENVVFELGAAAIKYGSRIVIFKEDSVNFPTNFRDIGHISFAKDQLDAKGMDLFRELIAFGLVKFSVAAE
jgi:predicted nucleotide-binding protein